MALKYVAGRSGRVVMTEELLPIPALQAALARADPAAARRILMNRWMMKP